VGFRNLDLCSVTFCLSVGVHVYVSVHECVLCIMCMHVCCVCVPVCVCMCAHVCLCVCICAHMYVCVCMCGSHSGGRAFPDAKEWGPGVHLLLG
jgi:hypothetical protein